MRNKNVKGWIVGFVVVTTSALLTGQGPEYQVAREIPLHGAKLIEVQALETGGFAFGLSTAQSAEVQTIDETGRNQWSRPLNGKLFGLQRGRARLLANVRESDAGAVSYVLDAIDGSVIRQFRLAIDGVKRLSGYGDAVVQYDNPFESSGKSVVIRRISNDDTRTIVADSTVGAAVAIDYDRVIVLMENGRLDFFQGNKRVWGRRLTAHTLLHSLQVASEAPVALVELPGGSFLVVDLADGQELYRYSPVAPERALSSLNVLVAAKAAVAGPDASRRLGILAANMRPTLSPDGEVLIRSGAEIEDLEVRLRPMIGDVRVLDRISKVRAALTPRGHGPAVSKASSNKAGAPRIVFDSRDVGLLALDDRVLLVTPKR